MSSHDTPLPSNDNGPHKEQQLELGEDDSAIALRKAWERTLRALSVKFNKPTFENFLKPLKPLSYDGQIVVLGAPSSFAREWAEKKYSQILRTHLEQFLDRPQVQVRFVISTPDVQPLLGEKPLPLQQAASPLGTLALDTPDALDDPAAPLIPSSEPAVGAGSSNRNAFMLELAASPLNTRYTFAHFVVGKSNRLAHAGALAVANGPGTTYNPLFLYGNPGLGKCVAASEFLMLADGRRVRAGDLVGTEFFLLSLAKEELRAVPAFAEFNAVEPVLAIETESGRRIVRNRQHPLWVGQGVRVQDKNFGRIHVKGWTPLGDVCPGDLVAVPECLPAFGNPGALPEHEVKLLAYLIGDGGFSQNCVRFSQQDNAQLAELKECVAQTNCRIIQHSKYDWRIVGKRGRVARGADSRNDVVNLLRRHGMMLTHSRDKRVPAAVFTLPKEQLCLFLSRLFATDGWASNSPHLSGNRLPRIEIGFCSASEGLVRDLQELLLKLGINARLSPKPKVRAWTLTLHCAAEILKFADQVGIFGKEEAIERVRQVALQAMQSRPNRGMWRHTSAPAGLRWEKVKSVADAGVEATVAIEVPHYGTFLSTFWEHNTHLMHAIGHHIRLALPQARVAYVSGETFTNHYVAALREKRTEDFRRAYRSVDVWLVDDIQMIASGQKEQTKEEFFHTFNTLHQMNKQIVIASDRSPRELRAMDDRLRSRFESGLIADIAPPELEMREAILQKKAILENLHIPDDVIAFMADLIQSNIRALEGALIKLMAYASLSKSPVTKQLASDVLSHYFVERHAPPVRDLTRDLVSAHPEDHGGLLLSPDSHAVGAAGPAINRIIDAVSAHLNIDKELFLSGMTRRYEVAFARRIAMYLVRELTQEPLSTLAALFHCKNHTAVLHAHTRLREDLKSDRRTLLVVSSIQELLERDQ